MKVFHIVHGRPIGPSFQVYLERPPAIEPDDNNPYGTWIEEVELSDLVKEFERHVEYMAERAPQYFPYHLDIYLRVK